MIKLRMLRNEWEERRWSGVGCRREGMIRVVYRGLYNVSNVMKLIKVWMDAVFFPCINGWEERQQSGAKRESA